MERKLASESGGTYAPHEFPRARPTPISDALLPDLHVGAGDAKCTHTNRQIVQNRLFSLLLNRLAANMLRKEIQGIDEPFRVTVRISESEEEVVRFPSDLLRALLRLGHDVKTRTTCRITTFGFALCVKETEENGEIRWIHIPVGIPLRSGIQTSSTTESIPAFMTHGNTEFSINGPTLSGILVESYHNQEGYAGWISSHYNNLPWMYDSRSHEVDAIRAAEVTTLLFTCLNSTALRMNLINGGYGTIGVCNDSAAIVDATIRSSTDIYPLVSIGGFYYKVVQRGKELIGEIKSNPDEYPPTTLDEARKLVETMLVAPNDIHPVPKTIPDTVRRVRQSIPENPHFSDMVDAIEIMEQDFDLNE